MLWFTEVDTSKVWWLANAWRFIWVTLDRVVYGILGLIYQIFFNIASADIFSDNSISRISQRIQLIIGVFVLFQLVMTIIRGIINPDSFTDSKTGAGNVIMRICTALIMLALLVPINFTSTANEYQEKVSQNGILFGTLYSLQYRILNNNTIGQIITGVDPQENESNDEYFERTNEAKLTESANNFVVSILRGFYRINLKEGKLEERDGYEPGMIAANRMCPDGDSFTKYIEKYASPKATPGDIFSGYDASCKTDGNKRYVFTYMPLASLIVGILFVVIMLSFCFDIAMRSIKLGILQIMAPIPIVSYMDPKGGKDGAFNAWVKLLISTYIDLFIRIATVYFAIFIIQEMLVSGIKMAQGGIVGVLTKILIYIALFYFAKEAPKFIKQALGVKDEGGGLFSGLGKIAGVGATVGGTVGSFISSRQASISADETNGVRPTTMIGRGLNRGKHLVAGIAGGLAGGYTGWNAATGAKDHQGRAAFDAMAKRNAMDRSRGGSGSTFFGRAGTMISRSVTGQSAYDRDMVDIKANRALEKTGKDLFSFLEGKGKTDGSSYNVNTAFDIKDQQGNVVRRVNMTNVSVDEYNRKFAEAKRNFEEGLVDANGNQVLDANGNQVYGDGNFTIGGETFNINDSTATKALDEITYAAGTAWAAGVGANDPGFQQKRDSYTDAGGTYTDVSQLKKDFKKAGGLADRFESSKEHARHEADHGATGGQKN